MNTVFGPEGVLAHHLNGYEPRPGQQEMAAAVSELLAGIDPDDDEKRQAASLVAEA